ncbi:peptidoglycan-binding domain-containing protein [Streptomyces alboflavus]|uniref:peptidoglycan-binding domain-containing protein n=1 Tax=Streptomyces alboflavus TaxID=67267 RepID=UPI0036C7D1CC
MHHRTTDHRGTHPATTGDTRTRRPHRLLAAAVAVTASAGLALAATAPLAQAAGPHVVDGSGDAYNDWGDEGTLSRHSHAHSNATWLWQSVLYADGAKWRDGNGVRHTFTKSDIDGHYGWKTASATKWWQAREDLEDVDGVVGKETFGAADDFLSGPHANGHVDYTGHVRQIAFKRISGTYYVKVHGQWKKAAYNRLG